MSNALDQSAGLLAEPPETERPAEPAADPPHTVAVTRAGLERSLPLFLLFLSLGAVILAFAYATVHHRTLEELTSGSHAQRHDFPLPYWLRHGPCNSGGSVV